MINICEKVAKNCFFSKCFLLKDNVVVIAGFAVVIWKTMKKPGGALVLGIMAAVALIKAFADVTDEVGDSFGAIGVKKFRGDIIAAKAVTFQEALHPSFKNYIKSVLANAKILSETLKNNGFKIFSGGTDTHLMLVDLRPFNVTGKAAETSLGKANITCNKNGIPFDTQKMTVTSGIRLGSQAATTRGFGLNEFKKVGELITKIIVGLSKNPEDNSKIETDVKKQVVELCSKFPIYNHLIKK